MSGTFLLALVSAAVFAVLVTMFVRRSHGTYVAPEYAHYYTDPDAVRRAWEAQQRGETGIEPDEPRGLRLVQGDGAEEGAA